MGEEIWKPVVGWEGIYEVSNMGVTKRLPVITNNNIKMPERLMTYEIIDGGYLRVQFVKRPKKERFLLHRLVAIHFISNPDNKPEVNHKDGDKTNNAVSNLEWSTSKENMTDAACKGLRGNQLNKRLPLSVEVVLEIFNSNLSLNKLAEKYNTTKLIVQSIKTGKRRGKITGKLYNGKK